MKRGRLKGIARVRRIMRGLPESARGEIVVALHLAGRQLQAAMRARAPVRRGKVRDGILYRVYPKTLRLRVGLLSVKRGQGNLFYGRIQDLGRKAQTVNVERYRRGARAGDNQKAITGRKSSSLTVRYKLRVKAMAPKRFVTGRYAELRNAMMANLQDIYQRALRHVAGGGDA